MKKMALLLATCLVIAVGVSGLAIQSHAEEVRRYDAARVIVEHICLLIRPPLEETPAEMRYDALTGALASRGINNFLGTDPDEALTVGDMNEIFDAATFGEDVIYSEERSECPTEVGRVLSMDPGTLITLADFQKVVGCFPYCDMGTAETYTPPMELGGAPEEIPENPATEIF
jgi:hypothetical protein